MLLSHWREPQLLLISSMFAAQIGLVTIWAILGTFNWVWRLPASLVLIATLVSPLSGGHYRYASDLYFVTQTVTLAMLCVALRWRRFRLVELSSLRPKAVCHRGESENSLASVDDSRTEPLADGTRSHSPQGLHGAQFSLLHVLAWTTSLAVVLGIARALDLLKLQSLASLLGRQWFSMLAMGILAAIVILFALWAALGQGSRWLRWSLLIVITFLARFVAGIPQLWAGRRPVITSWDELLDAYSLDSIREQHWTLAAQYGLTAALLAAALLIFRVLGYRLLAVPSAVLAGTSEASTNLPRKQYAPAPDARLP
jgi:hypothetical protein